MSGKRIFVSHATEDDAVVAQIRQKLEGLRHPVWVDSRELSAGDDLEPSIRRAIDEAAHFVVVLSLAAVNSPWVRKEVQYALEVKRRRTDSFKVIPLLLRDIKPTALHLWFDTEPVAVTIEVGPGGVAAAMSDLLAALGEQLPTDSVPSVVKPASPVADLVLELTDPAIRHEGSVRRATANATLTFYPPEPGARRVESRRYPFVAPLGPIETGELSWYLEDYASWPGGWFAERAGKVEAHLPGWGKQLHTALLTEAAREAFSAWNGVERSVARRFTVQVDSQLVEGSDESEQGEANEAATLLLSLPWELLHDAHGYLFQGARPVRVRRTLPNRERQDALITRAPIRVLLVSPRPEDERAGYIDHRVSARPLVEALSSLGDLAELTLLTPPTFPALEAELSRAQRAGRPYHVVHFDGHGVYDPHHGLGALVFEDPADAGKPTQRRSHLVDAKQIAAVIREHRVPLFFLEACQSAMSEMRPDASVAGQLLQSGVASVAAMSHSVLVETARRFVTEFYAQLMQGATVGEAMLAGRRALFGDSFRGKVFTGDLRLHDWFVPILYQETEQDPPLVAAVPAQQMQAVQQKQHELSLDHLPAEPEHTFVGRSRELLMAERLLMREPSRERYVVIVGEGGEGKTTIAAELARWLVATQRFERAAFVPFDKVPDARAALWSIGEQLVPGFLSEAGQDVKRAQQLVERALADQRVVLVFDNLESVLPPPPDSPAAASFEPDVLRAILALCEGLATLGGTHLVFTSREPLPENSAFGRNAIRLGRLDRQAAIQLVEQVLSRSNLRPRSGDAGSSEAEVAELVEAVGCHARALVLIAREVGHSGVRGATERLHELMAELHKKYPDDRERSLFASVELSLRRLPAETRQRIRPLGVFLSCGSLTAINMALDLDPETTQSLGSQLVDVGLAEPLAYGYLRFDPALAPALLSTMSETEREAAQNAWAEAMVGLVGILYQQKSSDWHLAATLTQSELPNLLAALEHLGRTEKTTLVIEYASLIEDLIRRLGRPRAMARAAKVRANAARRLEVWSHSSFLDKDANIDRLLDAGRFAEAVTSARSLLQRFETDGEKAYPGAAYDLASAYFDLGLALLMGGTAEAALTPFTEARRRFETLAAAGDELAARRTRDVIVETATCLLDLGRLDEAAVLYEEGFERSKHQDDPHSAAVSSAQFGTVRRLQKRYAEAITAHTEARKMFKKLGDVHGVALAWHNIGMDYADAGDYPSAEQAYKKSLRIKVQIGDRSGEAATYGELGNLYESMNRKEDAVRFHSDAAVIYVELEDLAKEGVARSNIADLLIRLGRFDEARQELMRAVECKKPFGHAAEPWKTFGILHSLERTVGNAQAASAAREEAMRSYLAYRRAGGQNLSGTGNLFVFVSQAIASVWPQAASAQLAAMLANPNQSEHDRVLLAALQQMLAGVRDPVLAADPNLGYGDAAELLLLLEGLPASPPGRS